MREPSLAAASGSPAVAAEPARPVKTADNPGPATASPRAPAAAPFLYWPVGRREYYAVIAFALGLPLAWGVMLFGWQALGYILCALGSASLVYTFLKLLVPQSPRLQFTHVAASCLVTVALACPIESWLVGVGAGAMVALLVWLLGGPARGRPPAALIVALLVAMAGPSHGPWPLLKRNRLLFGNARHAQPVHRAHWPMAHSEADAVAFRPPSRTTQRLLAKIWRRPRSREATSRIRTAMAFALPPPRLLFLGVVPGRIGCAGLFVVVLAGLYLSYRHILRAGSWILFLSAVVLGLLVCPLSWPALAGEGWRSFGGIWSLPAGPAVTLVAYELCSADFIFASVFLLAMPGMMPITPTARRWFLPCAGVLAALFHRLAVPLPPATLALAVCQPFAPYIDGWLKRRSWLSP